LWDTFSHPKGHKESIYISSASGEAEQQIIDNLKSWILEFEFWSLNFGV
jgi:hypothetical protein